MTVKKNFRDRIDRDHVILYSPSKSASVQNITLTIHPYASNAADPK